MPALPAPAPVRSSRPSACSVLSLDRGEPLAGTASVTRGYLVLEHGGPWGAKVLRDAVFAGPDGRVVPLGEHLAAVGKELGVTTLLARRHHARHGMPAGARVWLAALDGLAGGGATTNVAGPADLLSWDLGTLLGELRAGGVPAGWEPMGTGFFVCTQARRDACCGELGRPIAAAVTDVAPEAAWEVSHIGGHRLAANVLVLPDGLAYGRLGPADAGGLVAAHRAGAVLVDRLRGRAGLSQPVQAAEVALRRRTGRTGARDLALAGADVEVGLTTSRWLVGEEPWEVVVRSRPGDGGPVPASCGAEPGPPATVHEVLTVSRA